MKKILLTALLILLVIHVRGQFTYGTTGLLNMPTADMQKDKTFMFGGGYLEKHSSPARWFYDTWNYYINITFFPWMEVSYHCILHKSVYKDYGTGLAGFLGAWHIREIYESRPAVQCTIPTLERGMVETVDSASSNRK